MKTSIERILTTQIGSLPRPADLDQLLFDRRERWGPTSDDGPACPGGHRRHS